MKAKKKGAHMDAEAFSELTESLNEALQHARGERHDLRTTTRENLPAPPRAMSGAQISHIRQGLNFSQAVFAHALNLNVKTVQGWEQGLRRPSGASLKLLAIAEVHPEILTSPYKKQSD